MIPHATTDTLTTYLADTQQTSVTIPDNPTRILHAAWVLVADWATGYQTTSAHDPVLINAQCAQAAYWLSMGLDPTDTSMKRVVASSSLLGGSISYAGSELEAEDRRRMLNTLCLEARLILDEAMIHPRPILVVG